MKQLPCIYLPIRSLQNQRKFGPLQCNQLTALHYNFELFSFFWQSQQLPTTLQRVQHVIEASLEKSCVKELVVALESSGNVNVLSEILGWAEKSMKKVQKFCFLRLPVPPIVPHVVTAIFRDCRKRAKFSQSTWHLKGSTIGNCCQSLLHSHCRRVTVRSIGWTSKNFQPSSRCAGRKLQLGSAQA